MANCKLNEVKTWAADEAILNVIVETAKGSRNKFRYEPEIGSFALGKVLPQGMAFPYDFGFIPSTLGEDGDPLDALVLMDEPAFAGCRIECRLIGIIEGEEFENGKTERNDRLVAVAKDCHEHSDIQTLKDLNENLLDQLEHFFVAYHDLDGKKFKVIGKHGPHRAVKCIKEGMKKFGKELARSETEHGKGQ